MPSYLPAHPLLPPMILSSELFDAYLKCPMKCWLHSQGGVGTGNAYADWARTQRESYRSDGIKRLLERFPVSERAMDPVATENLKAAKWRLAVDFVVQASSAAGSGTASPADSTAGQILAGQFAVVMCASQMGSELSILESRLHAVERLAFSGRGKPAQLIPIRFIFANKITKDDKLLLAFDQLVLSKVLGRENGIGKIVHGDDHAILKVRTSAMMAEVRKRVEKTAALLSSPVPPDLVLCRHCGKCEFQAQCRQKAMENDDLSLLGNMTEQERKKYRSKGLFTVTQMSYSFRPRRRPKRLRDKREKYHHSLKALAIREKKIHVVGSPELKIDGTPVFLDVEALPDRDFYYLIGLRIDSGESVVQHSLWADGREDEKKIWRDFINLLEQLKNPVLICYGSFERTFLKAMCDRYGGPDKESIVAKAISSPLNLLSFIYGRIYFPTFSNGLKEIAAFLGFKWSEKLASGLQSISWREMWEASRDSVCQKRIIRYNSEDCEALELVMQVVSELRNSQFKPTGTSKFDIVDTNSLKREHPYGFKNNTFFFPELEAINKSAYWDYQRERVYFRSNRNLHKDLKQARCTMRKVPINKRILHPRPSGCPFCKSSNICKHTRCKKILYDLKLTSSGIRRWVVQFDFHRYICQFCGKTFNPERVWAGSKYGSELDSYFAYQIIELRLSEQLVIEHMNKLFGLQLGAGVASYLKRRIAKIYKSTYEELISKIIAGKLIHADETKISVGGKDAFVWVFASMTEVVYFYSATREGDLVRNLLKDFKGVLVSDFYAAYEGIECPQQKCLIHLIRDLNDTLYKNPYDEELKLIAKCFTDLLKPMIDTVDRHGLKSQFLQRHIQNVDFFYNHLSATCLASEVAMKFKKRFEKNRNTLFTFLNYDEIPWNNNNAEHAIKAFAMLRHVIKGSTSEQGLSEYLILLSIRETCKYKEMDFLDFLRSGAKDIDAFAATQQRRCRRDAGPFPDLPLAELCQQVNPRTMSREEAQSGYHAIARPAASNGASAGTGETAPAEPAAVVSPDDIAMALESFRRNHAQQTPCALLIYPRQLVVWVIAYAAQKRECGESLLATARRLGLPYNTLRRWCNRRQPGNHTAESDETISL